MADNQTTGASSDATENTGAPQKTVPYDRFQEVNERAKNAEAELARVRTEAAAAREKDLKEQGKYEELYKKTLAELEAEKQYKLRADVLNETINATNQKRIERIPEGMRSVIPLDYPPEKLSTWLDANEAVLTKAPAPPTDAGKQGDSGRANPVILSDMEMMAAKAAGMTPERYAQLRDMRGATPELKKPEAK